MKTTVSIWQENYTGFGSKRWAESSSSAYSTIKYVNTEIGKSDRWRFARARA